jgi:hypothetical protein
LHIVQFHHEIYRIGKSKETKQTKDCPEMGVGGGNNRKEVLKRNRVSKMLLQPR